MKKRLLCLLFVLVLSFGLCTSAFAANIRTEWTDITYRGISIVINDVEIAPCDEKGNSTEPFIMNDTTYLPVRAIAGALGLNVGWEPSTSTVVLERGGEANYGSGTPAATFNVKHVSITYRGTNISLDGENIPLVNRNGDSVEPFIYNGTNYLPLRVVSEALGLSVGWDGATSTVTLKGGFEEDEEEEEELPPPSGEKVLMPIEEKYYIGYTGFPSSFEEVMTTQYTYNARGQLIKMASSDGYASLVCKYDDKGRLHKGVIDSRGTEFVLEAFYGEDGELEAYFEDGSIMAGHMLVKDAEGRIIKEAKYENNTSGPTTVYEYDADGHLALRTVLDPSKYNANNTYEKYYYDETGRLVSSRIYTGKLEELENYGDKLLYQVDDAGTIITKEKYTYDDQFVASFAYTYDDAGRMVNEIKTERVAVGMFGGNYTHYVAETMFEYDAYGNVIKEYTVNYTIAEREDDYKETVPTGSQLWEYSYDEQGRLLREYRKYQAGEDYVEIAEHKWDYDEHGCLLEDTITNGDVSGQTSKYVTKYYYDSQDRLVKEEYLEFYKEDGGIRHTSEYSYDSMGKLLEYVNVNADGGSQYKEKYQYDAMGNNIFYEIVDQGTVTSRAYFEYDENGLLLSSEVQSMADGVSVITEVSYTSVPKANNTEFFNVVIGRFMQLA